MYSTCMLNSYLSNVSEDALYWPYEITAECDKITANIESGELKHALC